MQPTHLQAPMLFAVAHVYAYPRPRHKIDVRNALRHVPAGEKNAAAQVEIGRQAAAGIEIPFECERVDAHAVNRTLGLKDQIHRHGIYGVFETPAKKARTVSVRQYHAVTHADIPDAGLRDSIERRMPCAAPDL